MKSPRIAIHHVPGTFSDRWLEYCRVHRVDHQVVNCHDSGIVSTLKPFDILLWHWLFHRQEDVLCAIPVLRAAERLGLIAFPDVDTCCTYDNKVAQKYLLESIGAPLVPSHVFFDRSDAHSWAANTDYPKVFKLSKGAGAMNVRLVSNAAQARRLIDRSFRRGFKINSGQVRENVARFRRAGATGRPDLLGKLRRLPRTLAAIHRINGSFGRERGYVYFQDFVPGNTHDIRVTVIGDRAFAFRRAVRPKDFRASGSGLLDYDLSAVNSDIIQLAFHTARRLSAQSVAFDFLLDESSRPLICEISYCFVAKAVYGCPGHWDSRLQWHEGHLWPQDAIIQDCIEQARTSHETILQWAQAR